MLTQRSTPRGLSGAPWQAVFTLGSVGTAASPFRTGSVTEPPLAPAEMPGGIGYAFLFFTLLGVFVKRWNKTLPKLEISQPYLESQGQRMEFSV